ncbi:hypothetical protein [Endozoicomonas numazuensis]|uniref:Uncharacterized protein n=1 Tax=Endozoicomonas numazuensis TaxID=1137799 RepID=A0A081NG70_9GAMM|nr:hypothetical protein [Endozoicomonas numazuensis]KEQ17443.1 hypothetical protein GZ78_16845 [Endozoicomonas numazuensis]
MQLITKHLHSKQNPIARLGSHTVWLNALLLLSAALLCGCSSGPSQDSSEVALEKLDVNELKMTMLADISSTVVSDGELANNIKTDIARLAITPLRRSPEVQIAGSDEITRPVAVSFQKAFEQSLMNMMDEAQLSQAAAIIHTRKPTTPLCNPAGKVLRQTMSVSMQGNPHRTKTIEDRTVTLRRMAQNGPPMDLYVAYVKGGLDKRSPEEQLIYKHEVNSSANTSLHNEEMACSEMPDAIVGASYVLTTKLGHTLYFANNGTQAADATGSTLWRYWFGSLKDAPVDKRYKEVFKYLKECGLDIPDIPL